MERSFGVLRLPLFLNLRTGAGIKVVANLIAGSQSLVTMEVDANHSGYGIIRLTKDREDVHVSCLLGEGTQTACREAYRETIRSTYAIFRRPVVGRLDAIHLVQFLGIFGLEIRIEEWHSLHPLNHQRHSECGVTHALELLVRHTTVQLLNGIVDGEPYGSTGQIHLHAVLPMRADGRRVAQHLFELLLCNTFDGSSVPLRMFFRQLLYASIGNDIKTYSVK